MIIRDRPIPGSGMSFANNQFVLDTSNKEDIRLSNKLSVVYSFSDLQEIVNIVYQNKDIPLNDVFKVLESSGYDLVNESDVDTIMLWIKHLFTLNGKKL